MIPEELTQASEYATKLGAAANVDIFLLSGELSGSLDDDLRNLLDQSQRNTTAFLILATDGGDPHLAYRLARQFGRAYDRFVIYVDGPCFSAGTLLAIGAHALRLTDRAQMGPMDIQLRKPDELGEMSSGLTTTRALDSLRREAFGTFENYLYKLKRSSGGQITLKTAMEVAATLTVGLFQPIYAQFDPTKLGEIEMKTQITHKYGERLDAEIDNLKLNALARLVGDYPSHDFVIDREEAEGLFFDVEKPEPPMTVLLTLCGEYAREESRSPTFLLLNPVEQPEDDGDDQTPGGLDGSGDGPPPSGGEEA